MDDYSNSALYGLWKACLGYSELHGVKFSTYAWKTIYGYLRNAHFEVWKPSKMEKSDRTAIMLTEDRRADRSNPDDYKELIARMLARLKQRRRKAIELRFGLNGCKEHTFEEIGKILHVTRCRSYQIVNRAILEIKNDPSAEKNRLEAGAVERGNPARRNYSDEDSNDNPWRDYAVRVWEDSE